jgi:hypothetical protein
VQVAPKRFDHGDENDRQAGTLHPLGEIGLTENARSNSILSDRQSEKTYPLFVPREQKESFFGRSALSY